MKLLVILAALMSVSAFASDSECPNLTLTCTVTKGAVQSTASDKLVDENWDEPSLKNCAATAYVQLEKTSDYTGTTIRMRAQKELSSDKVSYDVQGIHTFDTVREDGVVLRNANYSNTNTANSVVGSVTDLGNISINKNDVSVTCVVR